MGKRLHLASGAAFRIVLMTVAPPEPDDLRTLTEQRLRQHCVYALHAVHDLRDVQIH